MNSDNTTNSPYLVIAGIEVFENMMDYAESNYAKEYSCYSDFEEEFYENLGLWSPDYVRFAWESFSKEIENRLRKKIFDELSYEGAFFEQVDYIFLFVFKISGRADILSQIATILDKWRDIDGDDFGMAIDDIERYFSPSYSGEDKKPIWDRLGVSGIEWPPRIIDDLNVTQI